MRRTVGPPRGSAAGASPGGGPPSPPRGDGPSGSTVLILAPAWGLRVNAVPRQLTDSWAGTADPVGAPCTIHPAGPAVAGSFQSSASNSPLFTPRINRSSSVRGQIRAGPDLSRELRTATLPPGNSAISTQHPLELLALLF